MLVGVAGMRRCQCWDDVSKYHPSLLLLLLRSQVKGRCLRSTTLRAYYIVFAFCIQPVHSPVPSLARLKPFEAGDDDDDGLDKDLWVVVEKGSVCTSRDCTYRDAVSYRCRHPWRGVCCLGENSNKHFCLPHQSCRHTRFLSQSILRGARSCPAPWRAYLSMYSSIDTYLRHSRFFLHSPLQMLSFDRHESLPGGTTTPTVPIHTTGERRKA